MDITQVATLVNSVNQEIIGSSAILEEDLSNVVDVGKAVFDATSYDKYVGALVDHIGRVIFVDRKYSGSLASLYRDNWEYGAVMEKIYVTDLPIAVENDSWKLTNGTSYDPNVFTQPSVAAKFYNKKTTFEVDLSIADIQVRSAFDSATQLNAFISMLMNSVDTAINIRLEGLSERVINTLIANTVYDDISDLDPAKTGIKAVNLLKLYNDQFSQSLAAEDAIYSADPNKDPNAIRYSQLTYSEALAKNLRATDITAMALAMDNDMTMVCFGLDEENSIVRVVRGEEIGTTVKNEF